MTATALFPGFYRGAINLWVEDELTRDYLRKVWQEDPAIVFYVGGGNEGITAVLKEAELAGLHNVFALIDRDFGITNRADWNNPAKTSRRFVGSVHEVENHLLDADALAGCALNTGGRTSPTSPRDCSSMPHTSPGGWQRDVSSQKPKQLFIRISPLIQAALQSSIKQLRRPIFRDYPGGRISKPMLRQRI